MGAEHYSAPLFPDTSIYVVVREWVTCNNITMKRIIKGLGASSGTASGRVKIINVSKNKPSFKQDDILVTKITDPTMVPLMAKAGAIVCDIGGMTSHPSIVSRELSIPCVVATKNATGRLKNNMIVTVDGLKGEVSYEA